MGVLFIFVNKNFLRILLNYCIQGLEGPNPPAQFSAYAALTHPASGALLAVLPFLTNNSCNVLFTTPQGNTSSFLDLLYITDDFIWLESCTEVCTHEHPCQKTKRVFRRKAEKKHAAPCTVTLHTCVTLWHLHYHRHPQSYWERLFWPTMVN